MATSSNCVAAFAVIALLAMAQSADALMCYYCEDSELCNDHYDVKASGIEVVDCRNFDYSIRSSSRERGNTTHNIDPDFARAMQGVYKHDEPFKYECIKYKKHESSGQLHSMARGCVKRPEGIQNVCSYLQGEISDGKHLSVCTTCATERCNGAAALNALGRLLTVTCAMLAGLCAIVRATM